MAVWNLTQNKPLANHPKYAVGAWTRARGMIGRSFDGFDAMVFERCGCIHTFFMGMPLDVIFVDRENRITRLCSSVRPWLPCLRAKGAVTVIEMAEGAIEARKPRIGDALDLNAEPASHVPLREEVESYTDTEPVIPYRGKTS